MSPKNNSPIISKSPKAKSKLQSNVFSPRGIGGTFELNPQPIEGENAQLRQSINKDLTKSISSNNKLPPKRVSKESAISSAFKNEIREGTLSLKGKGIGDTQINEINKNI